MCMLRTTRKVDGVNNATDSVNTKENGEYKVALHVPCKLDAKSTRRLQAIRAGSIRTPHRLVHTPHHADGKCECPQWHRQRSDATHIFWCCQQWKAARDVYLTNVQNYIDKVRNLQNHIGKERAKQLKKVINSKCFQNF